MSDRELLPWSEKYRPRKVSDCILPKRLKDEFQKYVDVKNVQNMILSGGPGVGKTTIAKAMCDEIGCDYIVINASEDRGLDMLRTTVRGFASTVSMDGGRKVIICDEADGLTADAQKAFRGATEEFAVNCSFIFTCNYPNKLVGALHSRAPIVYFKLQKEEKAAMASEFFKRIKTILTTEKVEFDEKVVIQVIQNHFPDYRRILNELERHAKKGRIDAGVLVNSLDKDIETVVSYLKDKDFTSMRKWLAKNSDMDHNVFYRGLYDSLSAKVKPQSIPAMVALIGQHMVYLSQAADAEIITAWLLTEMMANGEFI